MSDYALVHYFCTTNGDAIQVDGCVTAREIAVENGCVSGGWWIEVQYYDGPEAVAGGEWGCPCPKEGEDDE